MMGVDIFEATGFFSFHYSEDVWRVGQVRNMGLVEGQDLFLIMDGKR